MGAGLEVRAADGPVVDSLGVFYICFAIVWTLILIGGMVFLYRKRDMPILRIRGLPLSFGAVILLHLYWLAVQAGYIYGAYMAPGIEFWIMGIWLPFGIALFHASNSRFLYVAEMQKRFIRTGQTDLHRRPGSKKKTLVEKYRLLDYTTKMLTLVCAGMAFQVGITKLSVFMNMVSNINSCSLPSSCSSSRASSTPSLASLEPKSTAHRPSRRLLPARAGSGGRLCSGSSSGLGSSPPSFSGALAASTTLLAGGFRPLAAALLGMSSVSDAHTRRSTANHSVSTLLPCGSSVSTSPKWLSSTNTSSRLSGLPSPSC